MAVFMKVFMGMDRSRAAWHIPLRNHGGRAFGKALAPMANGFFRELQRSDPHPGNIPNGIDISPWVNRRTKVNR